MRAADLHRLARRVREIALLATDNTGDDRVNAGQLAVLEDIAHHPGSTISDVTRRTGLAQSLVSRITHAMAEAGAVTVSSDDTDRRKTRLELDPRTRAHILERAGNTVSAALAAQTPALTPNERSALEHHLDQAERLLRTSTEREEQHGRSSRPTL
jgi:DNA-binding MarR family transcriptional regulator